VVERDIFRNVGWTSSADCMTPLVTGSNLLRGHLKDHVYAVLRRTIEDLVARIQTAVATVDANILRSVLGNSVCCTAVCVEMDCGRFGYQLKLRGVHGSIVL
jgi:hypothetical protein